jgi:hypothetical protein
MAASMPVAMLYAYLEFHRKTDWSNPCMAYSPDPMQNNASFAPHVRGKIVDT